MMVKEIHQFAPACCKGDGITNGMFFTRTLLRELGFVSDIYCELIQDGLENEILPITKLKLTRQDVLFVHHSLGYRQSAWLDQTEAKKILVYHNITPPEFLPDNGLIELSLLGRQQLLEWAPQYVGAIGDSEFNSLELRSAHYPNITTIPLLVDLERLISIPPSVPEQALWHNTINLLFIGRICENKNQLDLIRLVKIVKDQFDLPIKLWLVGGLTSPAYQEKIREEIRSYQLEKHVILLGKVSDEALVNLYRQSDVYISLSEHEGFGMPLIEAMLYDLPVMAKINTALPYTLGVSGVQLGAETDLNTVAIELKKILRQPNYRRKIIEVQRQNLKRFARKHLKQQLQDYLQTLDISLPSSTQIKDKEAIEIPVRWTVEGPFDSSYSLSLVNRELAQALKRAGLPIALRSHEGFGDFDPNPDFLKKNPDLAAMCLMCKQHHVASDVVLRFCFPPYLDDLCGRVKVLHSYCWEETGFPSEYVNEFNARLDLITVASNFVKKILRDNGVRVPIAVTGLGVNHLLNVQSETPNAEWQHQCKAFRFLHISSCFPRKGVDALLAAYGKAFRADDPVSLIIKTFPNPHNNIHQLLQQCQQEDSQFPHVLILEEDFSESQIRGLYEFSQAVVVPSRGEGFGLPIAEAMVFGLPVITTAWGGQRDFVNNDNAWLCNFQFESAGSHFNGLHSAWANPDPVHLGQLMRELFHADSQALLKRTKAAREKLLSTNRWDDVAFRTRDYVQQLEQQIMPVQELKIGWLSSWNTRCGVASYSSFLTAQIPIERLVFLASHTPERVAYDADNVIRCWTQDMQEDLEYVLLEIEERQIGAVVIQYNFGFFPLNALANLICRLKEIGVQSHLFFHSTADVTWVDRKVSLSTIQRELALADRLYVHGLDDLNRLKHLGLVENVVLFPHGLMPTLVQASNQKIISSGKRKLVIGSYGYLLPHKGILALIEAFSELLNQHSETIEWHLQLVNALYPADISTHEYQRCIALIHELNLADRITFHANYLEDADSYALLQQADLIVYPYQKTQESASGAVRFGLASGKPVAVTPLSIFEDVAEAVHILPGTAPADLAAGILALMNDEQRLKEKEKVAKAWMASREWPTLSRRLLNIIDGLANDWVCELPEAEALIS